MSFAEYEDSMLLSELEVLDMAGKALADKEPFSLVRVGDGENIVLAQYTELTRDEFINSYWMRESKGDREKGVRLPNLLLRHQMIRAISRADVVGICRKENDDVNALEEFKRPLTDRLFDGFGIHPRHLCHVFVNRRMVETPQFWQMICEYRTLLISRWAEPFAKLIAEKYRECPPNIVGCIGFNGYDDIAGTLEQVAQFDFDLALISAGVNAVVMAPEIAGRYGAVALDFGKPMMFMLRGTPLVEPWQP